MATPMSGTFDVWLTEKLTSVSPDIDTDVFVGYIIGILDENIDEDTEESISELMSGVVEADVASEVTKDILHQWNATKDDRNVAKEEEDIGDKLSEMLGKQNLATLTEKKLTKEEAERKAAILAQYSQVSDGEETDEDEETAPVTVPAHITPAQEHHHQPPNQHPPSRTAGTGGVKPKVEVLDPLLVRNVNKEEVHRAEREKREKAKEDGEKKKEKDRLDRQAQKQKQQERKDQEKKRTQKGEKRR
ncbi:coiled-coil domain-containing protein 43 [Plakobranchus ocellatus]|uniref:Coiled-coil domain-containing protein 43 n=1 Tax=Plakobranchus ocellatus TaxID=259542 RepID=A0AAV3ZA94_9GAST|nr:coiled-coil domain-containing protein 43 [Plakobranchus ocellatus]